MFTVTWTSPWHLTSANLASLDSSGSCEFIKPADFLGESLPLPDNSDNRRCWDGGGRMRKPCKPGERDERRGRIFALAQLNHPRWSAVSRIPARPWARRERVAWPSSSSASLLFPRPFLRDLELDPSRAAARTTSANAAPWNATCSGWRTGYGRVTNETSKINGISLLWRRVPVSAPLDLSINSSGYRWRFSLNIYNYATRPRWLDHSREIRTDRSDDPLDFSWKCRAGAVVGERTWEMRGCRLCSARGTRQYPSIRKWVPAARLSARLSRAFSPRGFSLYAEIEQPLGV